MKITYDSEVDALYIRLRDGKIAGSEEVQSGIILDYDPQDNIVGVEVLHLAKRKAPVNLDDIQIQSALSPVTHP